MPVLYAKVGGQWVPVGGSDVSVGPNDPGTAIDLWYDTDAPAALTNDLRWNTAWGIVATGSFAALSSLPTGVSKLTTDITFTSIVGRRYRFVVQIRIVGATTGNGINFLPLGPGLGGGGWDTWISNTTSPWNPLHSEVVFTGNGTSGAYYWNANNAGTGAVALYLDTMSTVYIEDLGPASGTVAAPLTVDQRWSTAWGRLNYTVKSADQTGIQSASTLVLQTPPVPIPAGRRVQISADVQLHKAVGDSDAVCPVNLYVPGVVGLLQRNVTVWDGSDSSVHLAMTFDNTAATSYSYALAAATVSGWLNVWSNGVLLTWIAVDDLGPINQFAPAPDPTPQWLPFPFANGWQDFGVIAPGSYVPCGYRKIGDIVYLRGLAYGAGATSGTIGTLPVGFRPPGQEMFSVNYNDTRTVGTMNVLPGGGLDVYPSTRQWSSLSGISFSVTP